MNNTTFHYTVDEEQRFLDRNAPTFEGYRHATQVEDATRVDIQKAESDLAKATSTQKQIRTWDRRALAWPAWLHVPILLLLAAGELFVNYLAAEGLLQDSKTTWGVTVFLTFVMALLCFGLSHEYRGYRLDSAEGRTEALLGLGWIFVCLIACTGTYLAVSLFLRERYFKASDAISDGLGSFAANPWFIASVLTILAGIGIASIVYVTSHLNGELAAASREARRIARRLPKLEAAHRDARNSVEQIIGDLDADAHKSRNAVLVRLTSDGVFQGSETDAASVAEEISQYLCSSWRRAVNDPAATGSRAAAPGGEQPPSHEPSEQPQVKDIVRPSESPRIEAPGAGAS